MLDMKTMLGSSAPKEDEDVLVRNLLAMRDRRLGHPRMSNNGDALKITLGEKPPEVVPALTTVLSVAFVVSSLLLAVVIHVLLGGSQ